MKNNTTKATNFLKSRASELGFLSCNIAKASYLESQAALLESWLERGKQGTMAYMARNFDLRLDVTKLVPGARSVVVLCYNYFPSGEMDRSDNFKIARYAYGEDYHFVIKRKLHQLISELREEFGEIQGRCFVDSAPVMERVWAQKAGAGWAGKNTLLLSRRHGSYFFLAELILDLELDYDDPVTDHCGTCTACIDACPTDALSPYELDSNKCISYLTIELKDSIDEKYTGKMQDWIFGCDICQEVCPWNRFSSPHNEPAFSASDELGSMKRTDWLELSEDVFRKIFRKSAVKRTGYSGLTRNIAMANRVP